MLRGFRDLERSKGYVMLLDEAFYRTFTKRELCDTTRQNKSLVALSCVSRVQVDGLVGVALEAGGSPAMPPTDHGFMYVRSFYDPDGHHWEVLWMDPEVAQARVRRLEDRSPPLVRGQGGGGGELLRVSVLRLARGGVTPVPADTPSGPAGSVQVAEFTFAGQPFMAINAGPLDPFNQAISFLVNCADQAEADRLWDALSAGGTVEQCGWLKDRYGVSWLVVPTAPGEMMKNRHRDRAHRVMEAMLQMKKLDIAWLRRAYAG